MKEHDFIHIKNCIFKKYNKIFGKVKNENPNKIQKVAKISLQQILGSNQRPPSPRAIALPLHHSNISLLKSDERTWFYTAKTAYSRNKTKFLEKWKMKTQKEFNTDTSKNIIAILWVRTNNLQLRRQVLNRNTTVTSYCQNSKKKHDTIQAKTAYSRNKTKIFGKMIFAKTKINTPIHHTGSNHDLFASKSTIIPLHHTAWTIMNAVKKYEFIGTKLYLQQISKYRLLENQSFRLIFWILSTRKSSWGFDPALDFSLICTIKSELIRSWDLYQNG